MPFRNVPLAAKHLLLFCLLGAGCTTTTEKYRYSLRIQNFIQALTPEEQAAFARNDTASFGASIEQRLETQSNLQQTWHTLQTAEAINALSPSQVADYYYHAILSELARPWLQSLFPDFTSEELVLFAKETNITRLLPIFQSNSTLKQRIITEKNEYGYQVFSFEETIQHLRGTVYPPIVFLQGYTYYGLLQSAGTLQSNIAQDQQWTASKIMGAQQNNPVFETNWNVFTTHLGLSSHSVWDVVQVMDATLNQEWAPDVRAKTLAKWTTPNTPRAIPNSSEYLDPLDNNRSLP